MTKQDFVDTVSLKNRFKIGTEIALAISISLTGLVLNYSLYATASFVNSTDNSRFLTSLMYFAGACLFVVGVVMLYKIWRDYKIEVLVTKLDLTKNRLLIDKVASSLRWATIQKGEIREYLSYKNTWPHCAYEIRILADNDKVYIDLQSIQSHLLDFGDRSKVITAIREEFALGLYASEPHRHEMESWIRVNPVANR